jgi:CNT family concentrative nucleoside transporter
MTRSQLMTLMTGGFATVSGSVLAAYVGILGRGDPATAAMFTHHILTASVLSAPAAFLMAKIMVPDHPHHLHHPPPHNESQEASLPPPETQNVLDALASGAADGLWLALNVGTMLVAFVAFLALLNWPLAILSSWPPVAAWRNQLGLPVLSLQMVWGIVLTPLAAAMSIPWEECQVFGSLLGEKIFATELLAYQSLASQLDADSTAISQRTAQIASYALCGFANIASIGVQIGAFRTLAPNRNREIAQLALRAMIGGALASWMTACITALFLPFG